MQAYFEDMIKQGSMSSLCLEQETADSGVGSTAPSEMLDITDRDTEFINSQEDGTLNLDPGLGAVMPTSPKRSLSEVISPTIPDSDVSSPPQRSTTANGNAHALKELVLTHAASNGSGSHGNMHLPPELVSMESTSTCGSSASFAVGTNEE